MLGSAPIVCFAPITDVAKARAFYAGVLGLRELADDGFALVLEAAPGVTVRLAKVPSFTPQVGTTLGWQVPDVPATVRALAAAGVAFERYPGMEQDELGVWRPPQGGAVAWFRDPFGNTLSVSQGSA